MSINRNDIEGALNSYGYVGAYSDKLYAFLGDLGYKGNLTDRVAVWRKQGTPLTKPIKPAEVTDGQAVPIRNNANSSTLIGGTARVSNDGVISGVSIPAVNGVITSGSVVNIRNSANSANLATDTNAAVVNNTVQGVVLPTTKGIVTNGQTITVTGGTVTINVASNAVTATFTPNP